jgi:nucleotide-binding universal stress UspA family protein
MLIPLDGSKLAEQALPYARCLAKALAIPVELLAAIDVESVQALMDPGQGRFLDTLLDDTRAMRRDYLGAIAATFSSARVNSSIENGRPEDLIIDHAARDKNSLLVMATHGRSGLQRWMLGSVADKVLHGSKNHLLLIRASDQGQTDGEASLKKLIVPLDGSPLAERVLPHVSDLAKKMRLDTILLRAYALPPALAADEYGTYTDELIGQLEAGAKKYLAAKTEELQKQGVPNVSYVTDLGYGAEKITSLARRTPDNLIAMCTHGRSGVTRWALGSVTERVVRHSGDPVLIIRAA